MSNILAGIGRGQMKVIDERIRARRANFRFYQQNLKGSNLLFLEEPDGFFSNRWLSCIVTKSFEQREDIRLALEKKILNQDLFGSLCIFSRYLHVILLILMEFQKIYLKRFMFAFWFKLKR